MHVLPGAFLISKPLWAASCSGTMWPLSLDQSPSPSYKDALMTFWLCQVIKGNIPSQEPRLKYHISDVGRS